MKRLFATAMLVGALAIAPYSSAQTTPADDTSETGTPVEDAVRAEHQREIILFQRNSSNPSVYEFSYDPPDSPALPLVGVSADQISRVDSFHKLGLAIANGDDETGTAVALDFSPYWALGGEASLEDYSGWSRWQRAYARAEASIAFSEGNDTSGVPSSLVLSFATSLLDRSDPGLLHRDRQGVWRSEFTNCIRGPNGPTQRLIAIQNEVWGAPSPVGDDTVQDADIARREALIAAQMNEHMDELQSAYDACVERTSEFFRWQPALDVGVAARFVGEPGSLEDLEDSGWVLWGTYLTGAIGGRGNNDDNGDGVRSFGESMNLPKMRGVLHVRYAIDQVEFDENSVRLGEADSASVVLGLEGGNERTRYALQAGYTYTDEIPTVREEVEQNRYMLSVDRNVGNNVWLNARLGHADGDVVEDDTFFTIGFSFSAGEPTSVNSFFQDRDVGRRP